MEWSTPNNVSEIRSCMGLTSYYKIFIKKFSEIGYPITSLQRKRNKFEWTTQCATSIEILKQFLRNAPVLRITNPNKNFMVCTISCKEGLGGVLM